MRHRGRRRKEAARLTEGSTEYIPELGWAETLSDVSRLSVETHVFHSETLNRDTPYYVYLPPDYQTHPNQRYPVLYMLHGMSGTNAEWLQYGLLRTADQMMRAGQIRPFIIVLPQEREEPVYMVCSDLSHPSRLPRGRLLPHQGREAPANPFRRSLALPFT